MSDATRPNARCETQVGGVRCGKAFHQHVHGACPELPGGTFRKHHTRPNAASQSFSAVEVDVLDQMLKGLLSKRDLTQVVRSEAFRNVARKVGVMRERVKGGAL
jgi:hypothetical protein